MTTDCPHNNITETDSPQDEFGTIDELGSCDTCADDFVKVWDVTDSDDMPQAFWGWAPAYNLGVK